MPSPQAQFGLFRRAVAVVALVAVTPLAACSGGDDDTTAQTPATEKIEVPGSDVTLVASRVHVSSAAGKRGLDTGVKRAVMRQTRRYVEQAIVRPLLQGKKAGSSFGDLFAPGLRRLATKADRAALTDEGVGKVSADLNAPKTKVVVNALVDHRGDLQFVATHFGFKLRSEINGAPLVINRSTELVFEQTPKDQWIVSSYRVVVTRRAGSSKTSTSATSETGKS
jgi:hypothetical protein